MCVALAALCLLAEEETLVGGVVRTDLKVRLKDNHNVMKDEKCKCLHEKAPKLDDLVVGPDGGVQWAFVRVTKGLEGKSFEPPTSPAVLDQKGCLYAPHVLGVQVGQPVEFRNGDPVNHNCHGLPFDNREFNFNQLPGASDQRKFPRPEIFKLKCDYHPWMSAWIGVVDHPYFAVTDADGRFAIKGLPPGKYTLEAWHERLKGPAVEITVAGPKTEVPAFTLAEK